MAEVTSAALAMYPASALLMPHSVIRVGMMKV